MIQGMPLVIYPVKDVAQAQAAYTKFLGVEPYVSSPYYVGYKVGGQEVGLDPNGHAHGLTGPIAYWVVDDIHAAVQTCLDAGAQTQQAVRDVGGGMLVAIVKDADGNLTGLRQMP